jgi:hypothetical protein
MLQRGAISILLLQPCAVRSIIMYYAGQKRRNPWSVVESSKALFGFRGVGPAYLTRAPRRALPRRRALCTNSKKPR